MRVDKVVIQRVNDKGISVGENSRLFLSSASIEHAKMGLASKDLSHVNISDMTIENAEIGIAAYTKKMEYGPATINAKGVTLVNVNRKAVVQIDSRVFLNAERIPEKTIDVENFYAKE